MSTTITEVINSAGYDPAHNIEDAKWLFAQYNDYDDLMSQAQDLLDQYDDYQDYCEGAENLGIEPDSFEDWRKRMGGENETKE